MKTNDRQRSNLNGADRQRKLTQQPILRIILVSLFIANLLIVYKLIHPAGENQLPNALSFASLAPLLRGSVLFFLALSALSLIGLACLDPETESPAPAVQPEPLPVSMDVPVTETARIIVFRPDLSTPIHQQPTLVRE